jgi:hypothetical protein
VLVANFHVLLAQVAAVLIAAAWHFLKISRYLRQ